MSWVKVKRFIGIILIIIIFETIRLYTGIPITIVDIIIFPITCVLIYCLKFYTSPFSDDGINTPPPLNAWQLIGFMLFSILLIIMGIWLSYLGIQDPLHYFSSNKGGGHGYTLVQLGVIVSLYSIWFCLKFIYRLVKLFNKSS